MKKFLVLGILAVVAGLVALGSAPAQAILFPPPTPVGGSGIVYMSLDLNVFDFTFGQGHCNFYLKVNVYRMPLDTVVIDTDSRDSDSYIITGFSDQGSVSGCQFEGGWVSISIQGGGAGGGRITEAQNNSPGILEFSPVEASGFAMVDVVELTSTSPYFSPRHIEDLSLTSCTFSSFVDGHCTVAPTTVVDDADPHPVDATVQNGSGDVAGSPITPPPTPTSTPSGPLSVGGIVDLRPAAIPAESGGASEGSDWSNGAYAALAVGFGVAFAALGVGGWYARRRWLG